MVSIKALAWTATAMLILLIPQMVHAQDWSRMPTQANLDDLVKDMKPSPAKPASMIDAGEAAIIPELKIHRVGKPVYVELPWGAYTLKGTAVVDAPIRGHKGCFLISHYGYSPDDDASEAIMQTAACETPAGAWRFSTTALTAGYIPKDINTAHLCPDSQTTCFHAEGLIEHTRLTPTVSRTAYLASLETAATPVSAESAAKTTPQTIKSPPTPAPTAEQKKLDADRLAAKKAGKPMPGLSKIYKNQAFMDMLYSGDLSAIKPAEIGVFMNTYIMNFQQDCGDYLKSDYDEYYEYTTKYDGTTIRPGFFKTTIITQNYRQELAYIVHVKKKLSPTYGATRTASESAILGSFFKALFTPSEDGSMASVGSVMSGMMEGMSTVGDVSADSELFLKTEGCNSPTILHFEDRLAALYN